MFNKILSILLIVSFILLPFESIAVTIVHLDPEAPNYDRLETVVRLKFADGPNTVVYKDYKGLEVMFETRDSRTKNPAWAGKVTFKPHDEKPSYVNVLDSEVIITYMTHEHYFDQERRYGHSADPEGAPIADQRAPLKIFTVPHKIYDNTRRSRESSYKDWLNQVSFFEWTLNRPYSINDLVVDVESLKIGGGSKFPQYYIYGYSSDGGCLSCATFAMALLIEQALMLDQVPV